MQVVGTKEEGLQELKLDSPPSLLIVGQLPSYDEILIAAEGEVLLNVTARPNRQTNKIIRDPK